MEAVAKVILPYLLPRDVLNLSMVSRDFNDVFESNEVWRTIFDCYFDIPVPQDSDFQDIDWKLSCANLLQQSPDDLDLHQKFCISRNCGNRPESSNAEMCLKPSKAHMNLLDWDFSSLENQLDSSSDSETIEKVCVEDLRCPSPTTSCQSASSLQFVNQDSNTNLLVNSSVSANSIIDKSDLADESISQVPSLFKFTREALQKRLRNLVNRSLKNFIDDPENSVQSSYEKIVRS